MRAAIWGVTGDFIKWVDVPEGGIPPQLLRVDDDYFIRRQPTFGATTLNYDRLIGHFEMYTEPVPIFVARLFTQPMKFETRTLRLFSGCTGVAPLVYDNEMRLSWKEKIAVQVRGLTAIRFNGAWAPEVPRRIDGNEQATRAIDWARSFLGKKYGRRPVIRFSAIGIDEFGRLICDVATFEQRAAIPDVLTLFTPAALATGLFMPTRLIE